MPARPIAVHARLVSLDGGVLLAVTLLLSAFLAAAFFWKTLSLPSQLLLIVLTVLAWLYLFDAITERVQLQEGQVMRTSALQKTRTVSVEGAHGFTLVHRGMNQKIGMTSFVVHTEKGGESLLPLGPCWRHHDLEAFAAQVRRAMNIAS